MIATYKEELLWTISYLVDEAGPSRKHYDQPFLVEAKDKSVVNTSYSLVFSYQKDDDTESMERVDEPVCPERMKTTLMN